ncbi:MAG: hypothetical protein NTY83_03315 [Candidatus Micrarchaeota archaeon]|nr:hypothetical protein [Candidatus Micrarchaeota archaeon]
MALGMIKDAFREGLQLTSREWKGIFREFLKVNAFALLVVLFSVIAGGAMIYFGMSGGAEIASISGAILIIVLFLLVSSAASSISYNIIEEKISGAGHDIWGDFVKNLLPVSAYTIILWLAIGIFAFLPTLVLGFLGSSGFVSEIALGLASQIYYYIALFLIGFVLQFSLFELVVARAAVLQSMGKSVRRALCFRHTGCFHGRQAYHHPPDKLLLLEDGAGSLRESYLYCYCISINVENRKIDAGTHAEKETSLRHANVPKRKNPFWARVALAASLALSPLAGCSRSFYSRAPESVVFNQNNRINLSARELGFVRGQTTPTDAEYEMERRGLTHIAKDTNVTGSTRIDVLTADYQHSVHIFVGGKYETGVELDIERGEYPHRYVLRVANIPGDGFLIMVLIRDAIEIEPTRIEMIRFENGTIGERITADLSGLENEHNGLERPLFVGYDLWLGIKYNARDREGVPWENGYIVKWENGGMVIRPVPFIELMQCSCVSDWAAGDEEE